MKWAAEAEAALKRVPFFVRKRVRTRVEKEAREAGRATVTLADLDAAKARYLAGMQSEVKGYQLDTCFGPSGCPHRAATSNGLTERLEATLKGEELLGFLRSRVAGQLKFHHEFRVTVADCPNACSQPQIKDVGIIGACTPVIMETPCSLCEACVSACDEHAIELDSDRGGPRIDTVHCLNCGECVTACPTGTLAAGRRGYRVQLGGRLGRHPALARELPCILSEDQAVEVLRECLHRYKARSRRGERFSHIFEDADLNDLVRRFCPPKI